jgi:hypothetical protein
MDKKAIAEEINKDIEKGIYEMFPVLKNRLAFIAKKLFNAAYIVNAEAQLSKGELETLRENDYISKYDE